MTDIAADAMPAAAEPEAPALPVGRIATLDIVRGIAVMGILAMNIVAFAMPFQAYMNPTAYGLEGTADLASWAFSFVMIDGKMRGLFSFLFGASTLLVIERATGAGQSPAMVHYSRMLALLLFGLIHYYLIWFGDILTAYALVGMVLYFFRKLSVRALVISGLVFVFIQCLLFGAIGGGALYLSNAAAQPGAPADVIARWREMQEGIVPLAGQALADKMAMFHGPWLGLVHNRTFEHGLEPIVGIAIFGWETLGYMLLGMAALKSGFLTGAWENARYRKWALICFGIGIPAYAVMAWILIRGGFQIQTIFAVSMGATTPFRPLMIVAIAATIILATRAGGPLVERIAAAGRAAFTNYLGTSIIMTTIFYGYGLGYFGSLSRIQLWIPVILMWVLMLAWSKPWLDRFQYGPLEWLWRSVARLRPQPLRRA